ncbi:MAG: class I SAM-dependent rRNA methyltransferase [Methylotenera sp.]|nr:class I SAM-dependent rRNA methyltransferase [Oligoflexia bacterium]
MAQINKDVIWRLRPGADRRFNSGHPWVYSNELAESPKGIEPGQVVELQDASNKFLARGYGNPASLISFRILSKNPAEKNPLSPETLARKFGAAAKLREKVGLKDFSYRLCFAEADGLPGLIIDRYVLKAGGQAFVIQAHTAGIDRALPEIFKALELHAAESWSKTGIVLRNDVSVRKLEGLTEHKVEVIRPLAGVDFNHVTILVASYDFKPLEFTTDLVEGQKTGFFLDQSENIRMAATKIRPEAFGKKIRILDLCCYVGQWSTHLMKRYRDAGVEVEVVAFDASNKALELAKKNIGGKCTAVQGDVLKDLTQFPDQSFDLIISDPPALIKGRKDIPAGIHAYMQLNTQVFRIVKVGGAVVCCSCSALLEEADFLKALAKAARRNSRTVQWIGRGAQAADHPMLAEFPEGHYLKAWVGIVSESGESVSAEKPGKGRNHD